MALDGDGPNSPFTAALLQHIDTPGLEVRHMLTRVRQQVIAATDSQQVPWDHSSLTGEFFFHPPAEEPAPGLLAAAPAPVEIGTTELAMWETVQSIAVPQQQIAALNLYLETYPQGRFTRLAEIQIAALGPPAPTPPPVTPVRDAAPEIAQPELPRQPAAPGPADIEWSLGLGQGDRRTAQSALTRLGYDPGGIDGLFGSNTRRALRDYQQANGQPVTGYLTAEALATLATAADASRDSANSCQWAFDGQCDEGRFIGHASDSCAAGTDALDCGGYVARPGQSIPANSCPAYL